MASPIHQSIVRVLAKRIFQSTTNVPANLQEQVDVLWGEKFLSFGDQWSSSSKIPDLGTQVCNPDNKRELKWVLEVGFSKTYKELKNDIRLWLEGSS
jgi:hypothetical protein